MVGARTLTSAYEAAAGVVDPELRVVTIADLGILRDVHTDGGRAVVTITPTYSGCPAMDVISAEVARAVRTAGWPEVQVLTRLQPAWTTDWITDEGRRKLAAAGIAPPSPAGPVLLGLPVRRPEPPVCTHCGASATVEVSRFGSTPCKALWRCQACDEPFQQFKAL